MFPGETVGSGAPYPKTREGWPVSELKVLQSGAGYYLGHQYQDEEMGGHWFPYTRESVRYWATEAEAQAALDSDEWERRS